MLGQRQIVGNKYVKIDEQHKFRLPAFTGAEVGEDVIVTFMPTQRKMVIGTSALEEKMYDLYNRIVSMEGCSALEKRRILRTIFGMLTEEQKLNLEKQIRIPEKVVESRIFTEQAFVVGKDKYIEVYPSEEEYTLSLKNN